MNFYIKKKSEYVPDRDKRRSFISGFTGSSGTAVISETNAFLWTDGRYFLQAEKQLDIHWKLMKIGVDLQMTDYLKQNFKNNQIGIDANLVSVGILSFDSFQWNF